MVFKEGLSSHYQEKIARHSRLLQASEQCFVRLRTFLPSVLEYAYFQK